jgi:hypothetical protein
LSSKPFREHAKNKGRHLSPFLFLSCAFSASALFAYRILRFTPSNFCSLSTTAIITKLK